MRGYDCLQTDRTEDTEAYASRISIEIVSLNGRLWLMPSIRQCRNRRSRDFQQAQSLRRTLRSYFCYYHRSRLHLSLDKDSPDSRSVQSVGRVIAFPEVGGLHHRYERVA